MGVKQTIWRFQQTNEKAYYLSVLRVVVSCWFLLQMLLRWPGMETFYSSTSFLNIRPSSSLYFLHLDPVLLKENYRLIVYSCIFLLVLNIFGIGRNAVSILLFVLLSFLNLVNAKISNGGDRMSLLLLFYLSLANTYSYYTLFKRKPFAPSKEKVYNLFSNLAAYSIVINLSLVYFLAGLFKLADPYWQNGTALHFFLNDERYSVFAAGGKYVQFPALILYLINYGTLLLELTFPVLICYKGFRNTVLFLCFLMHLGIFCFLMVYTMSLIFVIQYGLFYTNEEMLTLAAKIKSAIKRVIGVAFK